MSFKNFSKAINSNLVAMSTKTLFKVDIDPQELYEAYLAAFPEGTNPVYRERTEHDCSCCKNFIRNLGAVVVIHNNELMTIWDGIEHEVYGPVAEAMAKLIRSKPIKGLYISEMPGYGQEVSHEQTPEKSVKVWNHFHHVLKSKFVDRTNAATIIGNAHTNYEVLKSSLESISLEAVNTVVELIDQKSLYKGDEYRNTLVKLHNVIVNYNIDHNQDLFLWETSTVLGHAARFKNTVIGTLLLDISEGKDLEASVKSFETKVAPENYKRSSSLITQSMIDKAQKTIVDLGMESSLARRCANTHDITINNVLFADRIFKGRVGVLSNLTPDAPSKKPNFDKVEDISVEDFIAKILPKAEKLEVMLDNIHEGNLMTLVAPMDADSPGMFKWDNNFSWSYKGEVTDSMKTRVKNAGGRVDGDLRFSIQWNENNDNHNDLDAHCTQPKGQPEIFFANKREVQKSSGMLDVDVITPTGVAVENIIFTDKNKMPDGEYNFFVHNFSSTTCRNFTAEIEFNGQTFSYSYTKPIKGRERVNVATVTVAKDKSMSIVHHMNSEYSSKSLYGIQTQSWVPVSLVMNSPNFWNGMTIGNKHLFFILDKCKNESPIRGFYNEFLKDDLYDHRKVFEVLASKLKALPSDDQLSGVGFSSTQRNEMLCKVSGSFNRVLKIKF